MLSARCLSWYLPVQTILQYLLRMQKQSCTRHLYQVSKFPEHNRKQDSWKALDYWRKRIRSWLVSPFLSCRHTRMQTERANLEWLSLCHNRPVRRNWWHYKRFQPLMLLLNNRRWTDRPHINQVSLGWCSKDHQTQCSDPAWRGKRSRHKCLHVVGEVKDTSPKHSKLTSFII